MALGVCLLIIFVLYLIDKHSLWRRATKITAWFVAISILGLGCIYGWLTYDAYRTKKRQDAESAEYQARMRPIWDCEARNAQFSNAETECTKNPAVVLTSQEPSDPYAAIAKPIAVPKANPHSTSRLVKALYATDLTTTELGHLTCGHIQAGETATLLLEGQYGIAVKVRTVSGQSGWGEHQLLKL
ncbi:MAG: hypothetical protein WBV69_20715 [Candidatus Sulfotelmatobacter sp.]